MSWNARAAKMLGRIRRGVLCMRLLLLLPLGLLGRAFGRSGGLGLSNVPARLVAHGTMCWVIGLSFLVSAVAFRAINIRMVRMLGHPAKAESLIRGLAWHVLLIWSPLIVFVADYLQLLAGGHQRSDMHMLYALFALGLVAWWLLPWERLVVGQARSVGIE